MSGLHTEADRKRYLTVLADGKFHEKVDEDTEGAKVRTKKDNDGNVEDVVDNEGNLVYELTYPGFTGVVEKVQFNEGDYGTNINIDMVDDEDNKFVVSLSTQSRYGEVFMQALPNLDFNQPLTLKPYSFTPKGQTNKVRGINLFQDEACEEKVLSAFEEYDVDKKKSKVLIKDYPMPDAKKKYNSEKWKTFFATRREFVMDYLVDNDLILAADESPTVDEKPKKKNKEEGDDDDF